MMLKGLFRCWLCGMFSGWLVCGLMVVLWLNGVVNLWCL